MRDYGLQLYSVHDITDKDFPGALKAVAEMGYRSVETAGFFGYSAEDVRAMLAEYGLRLSGTHTGFADLDRDLAGKSIQYHQALGNRDLIIPDAPSRNAAEVAETVRKFNFYQPILKAEGISMAFHNHAQEFLPNEDGQIVHEILQKETDIEFEIDTYWAFVADRDPIALMTQLRERVKVIHLKDGNREKRGFSLGLGEAPVAAVHAKAIALGMEIVVESEGLEPNGLEEVKRCMDYLKTL